MNKKHLFPELKTQEEIDHENYICSQLIRRLHQHLAQLGLSKPH